MHADTIGNNDQARRATQFRISKVSEIRDWLLEYFVTMTPNEFMRHSALEQPTAAAHAIERQLTRKHALILVAQQQVKILDVD